MRMLQTDESYGFILRFERQYYKSISLISPADLSRLPQISMIVTQKLFNIQVDSSIFLIQYHKYRSLVRCDDSYVNRALAPDL